MGSILAPRYQIAPPLHEHVFWHIVCRFLLRTLQRLCKLKSGTLGSLRDSRHPDALDTQGPVRCLDWPQRSWTFAPLPTPEKQWRWALAGFDARCGDFSHVGDSGHPRLLQTRWTRKDVGSAGTLRAPDTLDTSATRGLLWRSVVAAAGSDLCPSATLLSMIGVCK